MNNLSKILLGFMLVMMICCVSAVSATDIDSTDDTLITDDIAVDDVSEIVEDIEVDDASDSVVDEGNLRTGHNNVTVTSTNYGNYFTSDGTIDVNDNLIFEGNFENLNFTVFKINRNVDIYAYNATFKNIGFNITTSDIKLNGGTFIGDENTTLPAVISIQGSHDKIKDVKINVTAPENKNFYAIDLENANYAELLNNEIYYVDTYANTANYNYAVKSKGGSYVKMVGNNITAFLPLKDVDYSDWTPEPTIDYDLVAGVAVESSNNFNFTGNKLDVTGNLRTGYYPTLDALLIVKSDNVQVVGNEIYEQDVVSGKEDTNYLYAIDIYKCNNILIDNNKIELNSNGGNLTVNGTGAAYGIQLTGPHTGVIISNNNITTANNGPNLGIYSQNSQGETSLTIIGNRINVTGRATTNSWALVSGMELQDNYANVSNNIIDVTNIGGYEEGYCVYGISYCQPTAGIHTYDIYNNTVNVPHGDYAVYLISASNSNITYNYLEAFRDYGDAAVYINGDNNHVNNNTP